MKTTVNAFWLVGCRVAADFLSFLLFIAVSRHFGPEGIGTYSYGFAVATIGFVIGGLGIEGYGVREYTRLEPRHGSALVADLLGAQILVVTLTVLALAVYLWMTGGSRTIVGIVVLLGVYQFASAISRTLFIPANAQQAMIGPAVTELCCRGGAIVVAVISITLLQSSLLVALVGYPAFGVILVVAAALSARRFSGSLAVSANRKAIRAQLGVLWSFSVAEAIVQVFIRVGLVVLTLSAGAEASGLYATGLKFMELALMPLVFMGLAVYPRLSLLSGTNDAGLLHASSQFLAVGMLMTGVVIWGLYFVVPIVLVPLLGPRFASTVPVLHMMTGLALVQAGEIVLVRLLLATDLQISRLRIIAVGTLLNIALTVVMVRYWYITGAVAAGIMALAAVDVGYALALRRSLRTIVVRFAGSLMAGLTVAAGITWLMLHYEAAYWLTAAAFIVFFLSVAAIFQWSVQRSRPEAMTASL
jgi:Membrane protein involved in the export of O-antigen and teichoic acid